ncbi:DUF484 family protein [Vibrio sp.]|uniref:DUF484 family protein n=1 Tax=Vibrio sp. TaxID=678 RepID=UPI003D09A172
MAEIEADALTAEVVAQYLRDNPDFFQQRRELVEQLRLPVEQPGAVSLVHIQLNRQRERISELEEEITALMSLAANNDKTFHEFMQLQEQLLKCDSIDSAIEAIEKKAQQLGLAGYVRLVDCEQTRLRLCPDHYQRFAASHLNGKSAYLGRLRQADRNGLLQDSHTPEMGSYVILPLVKSKLLGVLAFASEDGGHFQPHMDTLFLRHLALVFSHLLLTLPWHRQDERRCTPTA